MFKDIESEAAVVVQSGVYKVCTLATRGKGELFAKVGGGYVRLRYDGTTSKAGMRLDTLTIGGLRRDKMGNLTLEIGGNTRPLSDEYARCLEVE